MPCGREASPDNKVQKLNSTIRFIIARLRLLSLSEACHRLKQAFVRLSLRLSGGRLDVPPVEEARMRSLAMPHVTGGVDEVEIREIIDGKKACGYGPGADPAEAVEDIREAWEAARLQHVWKLLFFDEEGALKRSAHECACREIVSWIRDNPFPRGIHYKSAMECGLRIPLFVNALAAQDGISSNDRDLISRAVYEHAFLVSNGLSLYSSLGNHTACESVGLIFAGALIGGMEQGRKWLDMGIELLEQEIRHQILGDGGPAEQSFNYHRFVLDLYWLAAGLLEKNGLHDCSKWKDRLSKGEEFLAAFADSKGRIPSIGDSDDGHAVAPGLHPKRPEALNDTRPCRAFPDSGYTVIRGAQNTRLIFDHGPLGMAPLYNHGHADALSILLYKGDEPVLTDPGTYRYNGVPEWRSYFKGTRAHNTVTIDGLDQAVQETGFIWSRPYTIECCSLHENGADICIRARHNGYCRLEDPVRHTREIRAEGSSYIITDTFEGSGVHEFELNFHLHPDSTAAFRGPAWEIRGLNSSCTIGLKCGGAFEHSRGRTDPILGWYSPAYGIKRETSVLSCRKTGRPEEVSFVTEIAF